MPFIRVTDAESKIKIDLNVDHIIAFRPDASKGSHVSLINGSTYHVIDDPRQLRGFIGRAQGTLPEKQEPMA